MGVPALLLALFCGLILGCAKAQGQGWSAAFAGCQDRCVARNCYDLSVRYGKYCGIFHTGCEGEEPCDALDACCRQHDLCLSSSNAFTSSGRDECHATMSSCMQEVQASGTQGFTSLCPMDDVINTLSQRRWYDDDEEDSLLSSFFSWLSQRDEAEDDRDLGFFREEGDAMSASFQSSGSSSSSSSSSSNRNSTAAEAIAAKATEEQGLPDSCQVLFLQGTRYGLSLAEREQLASTQQKVERPRPPDGWEQRLQGVLEGVVDGVGLVEGAVEEAGR